MLELSCCSRLKTSQISAMGKVQSPDKNTYIITFGKYRIFEIRSRSLPIHLRMNWLQELVSKLNAHADRCVDGEVNTNVFKLNYSMKPTKSFLCYEVLKKCATLKILAKHLVFQNVSVYFKMFCLHKSNLKRPTP